MLGAHIWFAPLLEGLENEKRMMDCVRSVLFHSSTLYFIFISGYLFDYVNKARPFNLCRFYLSKVKNLLCPYLFLSTLFVGLSIVMDNMAMPIPPFINHGTVLREPADIALAYLWGTACVTYWYIPFILLVYLVAPLLFLIRGRQFTVFTICFALVPFLVQRDELVDFFRNFCFFFPAFVLGVYFSRNRDVCVCFIGRHKVVIACVAAVLSAVLFIDFHVSMLSSPEIVYYVQRMSIACLVIVFFEEFPFDSVLVDKLAQYSFSLYFLHDFVMWLTGDVIRQSLLRLPGIGLFWCTTITFIAVLLLCVGLIWCVRRVSGRFSRRFIGS